MPRQAVKDMVLSIRPHKKTLCKSLHVLVAHLDINEFHDLVGPAELDDELANNPRFVLMQCRFYSRDWQMGAHIGVNYWSLAEEFVVKRSLEKYQTFEFYGFDGRRIPTISHLNPMVMKILGIQ
ncbi:hypothetical protein C8R43DRAFT_955862 [Mycena crocata]|nr:hypothetical protein C8R43DRAFT_955862 [Mycena crocata]